MKSYPIKPGSLAMIAVTVLMLTPGTVLGQRGGSASSDEPPETVEQAQPAPQAMQCGQRMQAGVRLTERAQLERMREHMIAGMRRMAVRMTAVQNRIQALDRGEPDSAPPVEMGQMGQMGRMGQGMRAAGQQGNGMQMRDGSGMKCMREQAAARPGEDAGAGDTDR